jgi:geranylgeranylglycerol-phosphate geranylgeranyltransferase
MPDDARPNRGWWRFLDERSEPGGRAKGWLFVTHPGPSLLVTGLVVAASGLLTRGLPSARIAIGLTLVMLPAQLGIGALNDWADIDADRVAKPYKPIPRRLVPRGGALALALGGFAVSLGAAAWLGPGVLGVDVLGLGAGVSYDVALKRTPAAVVAWWAGFLAVPLLAMVATRSLDGAADAVPLAGLVALAMQVVNGLPDVEGDRLGGAHTLPVALGAARARWVAAVALVLAAVFVLADRGRLQQGVLAVVAAGLLAAAALVSAVPRATPRIAFPLVAVLAAGATVSWLAALLPPAPG